MKTNTKITLLAIFYPATLPFLQAQNVVLQDNRFISVAISATNPGSSSRNYAATDYQLNSIIHFNARIAKSGGFYTGSNRGPTPAPVQNPTPWPSATPNPTPSPTPPGATPTATPAPAKTPKPAKKPKKAKDQAEGGNT